MKETERIITETGPLILVEKETTGSSVQLEFRLKDRRACLLHWGLRRKRGDWQAPPEVIWPEGTRPMENNSAVQTPFLPLNGESRVDMQIDRSMDVASVAFVLFFPEENRWDNNGGRNYGIELPPPERTAPSPADALAQRTKAKQVSHEKVYRLAEGFQLAVSVEKIGERCSVHMATDLDGRLLLHWGIAGHFRFDWDLPPQPMWPSGTVPFDEKAVRTPFTEEDGLRHLTIEFDEKGLPPGISFVLYQPDTGRWLKDGAGDFFVPLAPQPEQEKALGSGNLGGLAEEIIGHEMSRNSWTLMHRFNLCYDLLDKVRHNADGLALVFVWLRFSAVRQLDWQRNYNTKPREVGHALDRLTLKLAGLYKSDPEDREVIRLILTTLGRGSNAQRVRDEVLNIMHRHHIKEVSGHFMEEWHQKLHNNATPDDIVICEAFLKFLRSDGDLHVFYRTLQEGGISKERLEGYERPIRSHPDFIPHLKDALIRDFEHFLGILKEVYAGTDLVTAIQTARYLFDDEMHRLADFLWQNHDSTGVPAEALARRVLELRRRLAGMFEGPDGHVRDLLFLDLALEDLSRGVVERNLDTLQNRDQYVDLITTMAEIFQLSSPSDEFAACLRHWKRLSPLDRFGKDWSLHADSVLDRIKRGIGSFIDHFYGLLQPKAEFLGKSFKAAPWTITLFSEEVMRGRPVFALSLLLQRLDPVIRETAQLGDWQVISPGRAAGKVEIVPALKSIQGKRFGIRTILLTDEVVGDEDIPEDISAVITPDSTDVLAHVAIRARNSGILFAVCYNAKKLESLKSLAGKYVSLRITAAGEVIYEESSFREEAAPSKNRESRAHIPPPPFRAFAVSSGDFTEEIAGGKSNNIRRMLGKLPDWVIVPPSVALPFGIFERVLGEHENEPVASRCDELIAKLEAENAGADEETLADLRKTILLLKAPDELGPALRKIMEKEGLDWPRDWDEAWTCIKKVWASKWNTRAYLSRITRGIPHDSLFMAVLIQEVVEAQYSYVIHTVNPFSGNRKEIYAEAVLGLGEALVGNYPGRSLSFIFGKGGEGPVLLSYPGKSAGLFGGGLIFRSDSNGEDLAGYAGAGLYDSFMLPEPRKVILDYTEESLLWDRDFRERFMSDVGEIGRLIEEAFGEPQDIEGAFSSGKFFVVQSRPQVGVRSE